MADDHRIRVILEAVDKGSANIQKFFSNSEKDINKFRDVLRNLKKEQEEVFLFGGGKGRRLASGQFDTKAIDNFSKRLKKLKVELKETFSEGAFGGFASGLSEEKEIRDEVKRRLNLNEKERQSKIEELDRKTAENKHERIRLSSEDAKGEIKLIRDVILLRKQETAAKIRDERLEAQILDRRIRRITDEAEAEAALEEQKIQTDSTLTEKEKERQIGKTRQSSRKAIAERVSGLKKERDAIYSVISALEDQRDRFVDAEKDKIVLIKSRINQDENSIRRIAKGEILRPSGVAIEQKVREENIDKDIDKNSSSIRKFGLNAGRAFGQFRGGLRLAKDGLSDVEKEMLKTSSSATRLGARLGNVVSPITAFRGRIVALIAVLQILGTLVVQFGAALVALASSAILAATALGGALLAGLTQLVPVVGLLAAAFSRLGAVLDAANLADKIQLTSAQDQKTRLDGIRDATQRLADSRYSLLKAGEAVKDSEYDLAQAGQAVKDAFKNQTDAVEELAEARKQAARDIVDANFEEKEAALALQEATLGILEAKQRLREEEQRSQLNTANIEDAQAQLKEAQARLAQVRTEGDQSEIAVALQQLSVAEQDLQQIQAQAQETQNTVKQAKIDVKQADLQQQQAIVRNRRARIDAAEARKEGVAGSDRVKSAQENLVQATKQIAQAERQQVLATRALRDSVHSLVVAKREEKEAEVGLTDIRKKATAQQEQLQQALGDLSPAERKLFKSIQRIKEIYKKNFRPITDIIISSFSRAIDTVSVLFKDPKILSGVKTLATAIAESVDKLAAFTVSPEFKKFITFSLAEAAKNVPKITDGFISLARVLTRVARAATPIFDELIDRFVGFLERLDKGTKDTSGLEKFFATAGRHLDSWIRFAGAVGEILGLIIKFSAPSGKGILDDLTAKLNEWSDWLRENKEVVKTFFADVRVQVGRLGAALADMTVLLFKAFSSETAANLTIFIIETVIPAFALFLQLLGLISGGLIAIFKIPVIGPLTQNIIRFGLALLFTIKLVKTMLPLFKLLNAAFVLLFTTAGRAKIIGVVSLALARLSLAIRAVGVALSFLAVHPIIAALLAIGIAVIVLEQKFHFLGDTLRDIQDDFTSVFNSINSKIDDFLVNPIKSAINKASSFVGLGDIFRVGSNIGDEIREGARIGLTGLGTDMSAVLRREFDQADAQITLSKNRIINSLSTLRSLVSEQLQLKLAGEVPADKKLRELEQRETARARGIRLQDASQTVKDARGNLAVRQKEVTKAEQALTSATTKEEKQRARERLRLARQAQKDAQRQLEDALKQQRETVHQSDVDLERERLQQEAVRQREALDRQVRNEEKRADALFKALRNSLRNKNWESVQKIFDKIVDLVGIENLGKASADAFIEGLIFQLKLRQDDVTKATVSTQKMAQVEAQQQTIAGNLVGASSQQDLIAKLKKQGESDKGILSFLLGSGLVDRELALAILRQLDDKSDLSVLQEMFKILGIKAKPKNILKGKSAEEFIIKFLDNPIYKYKSLDAFGKAVRNLKLFKHGGTVPGGEGSPVPIIAHAGEWVVNKSQQLKLAKNLGMTTEQLKMNIFGTAGKTPGKGTKPTTKASPFSIPGKFNLSPQEDPDGNVVWFIEMADGAFGQVSQKDARKIINTQGRYIPGYVRRSSHGFVQKLKDSGGGFEMSRGKFGKKVNKFGGGGGFVRSLAAGGVVMPGFAGPMLQSFAEGGTVMQQAGFGIPSVTSNQKNIEQNFNVTTQGETDWSYVLRLGALHAQSSYT